MATALLHLRLLAIAICVIILDVRVSCGVATLESDHRRSRDQTPG